MRRGGIASLLPRWRCHGQIDNKLGQRRRWLYGASRHALGTDRADRRWPGTSSLGREIGDHRPVADPAGLIAGLVPAGVNDGVDALWRVACPSERCWGSRSPDAKQQAGNGASPNPGSNSRQSAVQSWWPRRSRPRGLPPQQAWPRPDNAWRRRYPPGLGELSFGRRLPVVLPRPAVETAGRFDAAAC